jgi:hypothetical protein
MMRVTHQSTKDDAFALCQALRRHHLKTFDLLDLSRIGWLRGSKRRHAAILEYLVKQRLITARDDGSFAVELRSLDHTAARTPLGWRTAG